MPSGRVDFAFFESMLSPFESILGIWDTIFEPLEVHFRHMRVNFGHMEVGLWPVNGEFEHFLISGLWKLIFEVYESSCELWELLLGI